MTLFLRIIIYWQKCGELIIQYTIILFHEDTWRVWMQSYIKTYCKFWLKISTNIKVCCLHHFSLPDWNMKKKTFSLTVKNLMALILNFIMNLMCTKITCLTPSPQIFINIWWWVFAFGRSRKRYYIWESISILNMPELVYLTKTALFNRDMPCKSRTYATKIFQSYKEVSLWKFKELEID